MDREQLAREVDGLMRLPRSPRAAITSVERIAKKSDQPLDRPLARLDPLVW